MLKGISHREKEQPPLPAHTMHRRKDRHLLFHPPYQSMGLPGFGDLLHSWLENGQLRELWGGAHAAGREN